MIFRNTMIIVLLKVMIIPVSGIAQDLHEAVNNGNIEEVKVILESDPEKLESLDKGGYTPLIRAVIHGQSEIAEYLIGKGADLEAKERHRMTPLFWAINQQHSSIARMLIEKGANVKAINTFQAQPIIPASERNMIDIVELLIEKGADVNVMSRMGSAIHRAAFKGNAEIAKILADNGANLESIIRSMTPLHLACNSGKAEVVKLLIEKGADVNVLGRYMPPLVYALRSGQPGVEECAKILIENGANVNNPDGYGDTPLIYAVRKGLVNSVKLLLENGAEQGIIDRKYYRTLLHYAAINGYSDVAKVLTEYGIDKDWKDIYGKTALDYAGKHGNNEVVQVLISAGAGKDNMVKIKSSNGYLSRKLKNGEAYIWYMDNRGWTIKTKDYLFVFDNEETGRRPDTPKLSNGWISSPEISEYKTFAIYSCYHADPNTLEFIHSIEDEMNDITYVQYAGDRWRGNKNTFYLDTQETKVFDDVEINSARMSENSWTLDYLVRSGKISFYYPGFYHNDLETFKKEIDHFSGKYDQIDFAFIFITPGQRNEFAEYMIEKLNPAAVFPMDPNRRVEHFRETVHKLKAIFPNVKFGCAENSGDMFHFKGGKIK